MSSDFTGIRVIWPPDGTPPPKHDHDIVFVHGLHGGSVTDWQDDKGVCWPAEHLSLDLGNARILAFGYEHTKLGVHSDGLYEGGLTFTQGKALCFALSSVRRSDKALIPLTLVGNGMGGLVVKSALCYMHQNDQFDLLLRKTKHAIFLNTPQTSLEWDVWERLSHGSSSARSRGRWQVWSAALQSSLRLFDKIANGFNITSVLTNSTPSESSGDSERSRFTLVNHESRLVFPDVDHSTTSKLLKGSGSYDRLLDRIRVGRRRIIDDKDEIQRVRTCIGRRFDDINYDDHRRHLERHHPGTGDWLFEDQRFIQWARSKKAASPILWLTGPEGRGKSVLCSLAVEQLQKNTPQSAAVYLFLAFDKLRSEYQILAQLALQLLDHVVRVQEGIDSEVLPVLLGMEAGDDKKKLLKLRELIKSLVTQCSAVSVFIDGLDQDPPSEDGDTKKKPGAETKPATLEQHLQSTVSFLVSLASVGKQTPVRLWCSSQKPATVSKWMQGLDVVEIPVPESRVAADISRYLECEVAQRLDGTEYEHQKLDVLRIFRKEVGSSFLLASMVARTLRASKVSDVISMAGLQLNISGGIEGLCRGFLSRLNRHDNRLIAMKVISLVAYAKRPLTLKELDDALPMICASPEAHEPVFTDGDVENCNWDEIQRLCVPFLDFRPSVNGGNDANFRLSHIAVLHFLENLSASVYDEGDERIRPNAISTACLKYLSQQRYTNITPEPVQGQHFLAYAAKYWHIHLEESDPIPFDDVKSFLRSPQFLAMTRYQSLFLNRHFNYNLGQEESRAKPLATPKCFESNPELEKLAGEYRSFIREWAGFLQLGTTDFNQRGELQQCFWGALGKDHFLWGHGTEIEANQSFLLETASSESGGGDRNPEIDCYYESISHDGSRVAVWKMPLESDKYDMQTREEINLVREVWYVDGNRPPFRYGRQETLTVQQADVEWDLYDSSKNRQVTLIPIVDSSLRVSPVNERSYGTAARIGRRLFRREKGAEWTSFGDEKHDGAYWEDILVHGPWVVRSQRKQLSLAKGRFIPPDNANNDSTASEPEISRPESPQPEPVQEKETATETKSVDEEEPGSESASDESSREKDTKSETESDAESMESVDCEVAQPSDDEELMSSAGEFCDGSGSDSESSDESIERLLLAAGVGQSSDDDGSTEDESDTEDDEAGTPGGWKPSGKLATTSAGAVPKGTTESSSSDSSDADDESSESESDDDSASETDSRPRGPLHQLTWGQVCDLCGQGVSFRSLRRFRTKTGTYYQCSECNGGNEGYDICSSCFDKGAWCQVSAHLLSKAHLSLRTRRVVWEDGISQDTATPVINIVAECKEEVFISGQAHPIKTLFRYKHRHNSMLHDSQPVMHPSAELLVYPLDGRQLLFANLRQNTYFLYDVPFEASEVAETSGSTCVPVSVSLRFSPCRKYLHVVRFTARNDSVMLGPVRLHVLVLTIALSSKDVSSGRPRILPHRQAFDLGIWPRIVSQLPCVITWTDAEVYLSISGNFLRVLRFPLAFHDGLATGNGVCTLSKEVALPRSAQSRSVHFYPSKGTASARIILGSLLDERPEPPAVIYLKPETVGDWVRVSTGSISTVPRGLKNRDDSMIEEPSFDDDRDLVTDVTPPVGVATIEPILCQPLRDRLETGFKRNGIYCPCCFDLGLKLAYLRPPRYSPVYNMGVNMNSDTTYKLNWKAKLPALIEALRAGCQFCCYVAGRLLTFRYISHFSRSFGRSGARCCSQGSETEDKESVERVISVIEMFEWKVKPEERAIIFECEPLTQDPETRAFTKLAIRLPSMSAGARGEAKFMPTVVTIKGTNQDGDPESITTFIHPEQGSHGTPECIFELYSLPEDPASLLVETRPLTTSRGDEENLNVVKGWLGECQSNHAFCRQRDMMETKLPTRLVEIVDADNARLVETRGRIGRYIALSYCWGPQPDENKITTLANVGARLGPRGLPRKQFPGAIKDAVTVAEQLGVKYIWVDALCIIQDDIEDKNMELANMSKYYRNSYLTIAASTPRCTTGFIGTVGRCKNHPESKLPRDLVPLEAFCLHPEQDCGAHGTVYFREENPYQLSEEPINSRAWTLQENLLAPRVLLFGGRVMWFCQHMTHSDGGVEDWSFDENEFERTRREFQIELNRLDRQDADTTATGQPGADVYDLWHRIVCSYSWRALSYAGDKLPAISAVASEFSRLVRDDYLAGLWRSSLLRDLLWTTPDPGVHRPATWRAPTWSWASVEDVILYSNQPPKDAVAFAEIASAETVPTTSTVPFGEVERGALELTCPTLGDISEHTNGYWVKGFGMTGADNRRQMLYEVLKSGARPRNWQPSGEAEDEEKKEFKMPDGCVAALLYGIRDEMPLPGESGKEEEEHWSIWGLVLKPVLGPSGEEVYERSFAVLKVPVVFVGGGIDPLWGLKKTIKII